MSRPGGEAWLSAATAIAAAACAAEAQIALAGTFALVAIALLSTRFGEPLTPAQQKALIAQLVDNRRAGVVRGPINAVAWSWVLFVVGEGAKPAMLLRSQTDDRTWRTLQSLLRLQRDRSPESAPVKKS